jgi:hypothetical protein
VNLTNGGTAYFGANGIQSNGSANTVNAIARRAVFSTGTRPASAIQLQGGTTITADPPATVAEYYPVDIQSNAPAARESLVWADHDTVIPAGSYSIRIASGAAALVTTNGGTVTVRTVHAGAPSAVTVISGSNFIPVSAGHEVIVGQSDKLAQAALTDKVARRKIHTTRISADRSVMTSEVSLVSLMQNSTALVKLMHSSNPADRALANKLIKTAACLMQVTGARGAYNANNR